MGLRDLGLSCIELAFEATPKLAEHSNQPSFTTDLRTELIEIREQLTRMQEEAGSKLMAALQQRDEGVDQAGDESVVPHPVTPPDLATPVTPLETLQQLLARSHRSQN